MIAIRIRTVIAVAGVTALFAIGSLHAQTVALEPDADPGVTNQTVIVTAKRIPVSEVAAPFFTAQVDRQALDAMPGETLPEALAGTPGVLVQKTAVGQGSPYIRGFTGFRTLLLVDGVRLNNSVFRDGANQYWSTVDPLALDRLELVEGPASVLYGSDAVGGAVQAFIREPVYAEDDALLAGGRALYQMASASESHIGRIEGELAGDSTALALGLSRRVYGDVEAGGETGTQPKTGYDAWDWDLKLRQRLNADRELVAAWQHTALDDVWRTHATIYGISWHGTTVGKDLERILDQTRDLAYLQYRDDQACATYDSLRSTLSYHRQTEDQHRIKKEGTGDNQGFDVNTAGIAVEMEKRTGWGSWVYGLDVTRDFVSSYLDKLAADGSVSGHAIQGPVADDAKYDLVGLYAEDTIPLAERIDLVAGARGTYARADAGRYADPLTGDPASLTRDWADLSGDVRLLYWLVPERTWNLYAGLARAFRAPNLSDLTRLDTARTDEIETPSPDVDPEHFLTGEVGTKLAMGRTELQLAYFYTRIDDLIVRTPTGETIDEYREVTKTNDSEGYVHGATFGGRQALTRTLGARLALTWMEGYADAYGSDPQAVREPLRTMPLTLESALRWTAPSKRFWAEAAGTFADKEDRLSSADQSDTQRIPPGGTPGYGVLSLRGGWQARANLAVVAAVENVADKDYRIHGSGSNEPGRSFNLSVACDF